MRPFTTAFTIMTVEFFLLRLVHVLGGIFWVGSALFMALFLAPALATSGANTSQIFAALQQRRFFTALPLIAVITFASGLRLMWIASAGFTPSYFASASGRTFAASGAAAIASFLLRVAVSGPAAVRVATLGGALASAPEEKRPLIAKDLATLRRRAAVSSAVSVTLLVLGAAGMSVARYVR
jgi:uncharacterized membrane protein